MMLMDKYIFFVKLYYFSKITKSQKLTSTSLSLLLF